MSTWADRQVLIVGGENEKLNALAIELNARGANVLQADCGDITSEFVADNNVSIIILNHLEDSTMCFGVLGILKGDNLMPVVPVFSLVDDEPDAIKNVLDEGSADYITSDESVASILQKIDAVYSEESVFSTNPAIDITPQEATITATGIKVFVIEDDPLLRNLLSIRFEKSSFPCEFSPDGKDVIPAMKQFAPDVIILDLMLPGVSGFELLRGIKRDDDLKDVPVVVFSNKDGSEDRARAKELGADSFYIKAMTDLSELVETIETVANKSKS